MEVRFLTRNVELPAEVREYMEKKVGKIEKFFDKIIDTQVALNFKRGMNVVEITSNVNGVVMRGEDYAPDLKDIMGLPSAFIVFALAEMLKVAEGWISSILFDIFMTFPPLS